MTAAEFAQRPVHGTNLAYASLAEWLDLVDRIGGRIECSQRHYTTGTGTASCAASSLQMGPNTSPTAPGPPIDV